MVSAAVGILVDVLFKIDIGFAATIIRSFRIARIIKLAKKLKDLQEIVNTFVLSIPELINVGGLLVLFIYLYSVLGVFLFSHVKFSIFTCERSYFFTHEPEILDVIDFTCEVHLKSENLHSKIDHM